MQSRKVGWRNLSVVGAVFINSLAQAQMAADQININGQYVLAAKAEKQSESANCCVRAQP